MKQYPLFKVHMPIDLALPNVKEVLLSGFINEGIQVTQLTRELEHVLISSNLVLLNSCTSALTLALRLAGVGHGDDVVSTPMTCVATNTPIVNAGANIVWADIDPRHGMLDPVSVEKRITSRTKAVMVVAWAGTPPDLHALWEICKVRNVKLILDAAHAFGATYAGKPVHRWSDLCTYSFQAIKHFTTGDGGALVCLDDDDHARAKALKWFGLDRDKAKDERGDWKGQQWDADIADAGYKFNMNNMAAALGLAQLPYVSSILQKHRANARAYDAAFAGQDTIVPSTVPEGAVSSRWVYTVRLNPEASRTSRDQLLAALNAEGIMAGVVHVPNDAYACFRRFRASLPGVRSFSESQFSLPCGWWLDEADANHIAARVLELAR